MKTIFFLTVLAASHAMAASPNFAEHMQTAPCADRIKPEISAKLQRQTWYPISISEKRKHLLFGVTFRDTVEQKAYRLWSDKKSTWYAISDIKTQQETVNQWDATTFCVKKTTTRPMATPKLPIAKGFTDRDLQKLMKAHAVGLIYVWSPHMPLSVEGIKEIKEAAKAKSLHLTILMDGEANQGDADRWAAIGNVTKGQMTRVVANELYERQVDLHYPITFIYKSGFLSNRDYVGYKTSAVFKEWIDIELAELTKDMEP